MESKGIRHALLALSCLGWTRMASAQLELPRRAPAVPGAGAEGAADPALDRSLPDRTRSPGPLAPTPEAAARFVFEAVGERSGADRGLFDSAFRTLSEIGPPALSVAREELGRGEPARLELAIRVLTGLGSGDDLGLVVERLKKKVPPSAAERLLELVLSRDPTLGSPEFLTGLFEHPTGAMRVAGERSLLARLEPSFLPALEKVLSSSRASARSAALEAIGRLAVPGPVLSEATELLVRCLGDPGASVAFRAADLLADGRDEVETRLEEVAFSRTLLGAEPAFDRRAAYALLSLEEREDRLGKVILGEDRVPALLAGLEDRDPLASGACAAALAGIGYRSREAGALPWLDRDVPHSIVKYATGDVFHADFTALQGPCLRRLARITGQDFGKSGALWQAWWSEHAGSFHAQRAVLPVERADAERLLVRLVSAGRVTLLAGREAGELSGDDSVRALALSTRQAAELFTYFDELGLFGAERLSAGSAGGSGRILELEVGGARKRFEFPARSQGEIGAEPPWFDRAEQGVLSLSRANRWQSSFDPVRYPSALAFGRAEGETFEALEPLARARGLKDLLLARTRAAPVAERDAGLAELALLLAQPGVASSADFGPCLELLESETDYGPRVFTLVDLLLAAAAPTLPATSASGDVDPTLARDLVHRMADRFGEGARPALERVLARSPGEVPRRLARDERAWLRALSAVRLAAGSESEDVRLAIELAKDPDPRVAQASIGALGWNRVEEARAVLEEAARSSAPSVRRRALFACAELGGEAARELALEALADPDEGVAEAAFRALAEVADPRDATLFAAHLARGAESSTFDDAARAFVRLRDAGRDELGRLLLSANRGVRRQAALILARRAAPEAVSGLLRALSEDPSDARVAEELSILSCIDFWHEPDPARAGWEWWDLVVHDDALAWLRSSAERAGFATPPAGDLAGNGTRAGALFLLDLAEHAGFPLAERAARELARRLGAEEDLRQGVSGIAERRDEVLLWIEEVFGE